MAWESPHAMGRDYVVIMCACTNASNKSNHQTLERHFVFSATIAMGGSPWGAKRIGHMVHICGCNCFEVEL